MIVSVPLPLPDITPEWDKWWNIWNIYAQTLKKTGISPNRTDGLHKGFDVFRRSFFNPVYKAPLIDLRNLYPSMYESLMTVPVDLYCIRFVKSEGEFLPHMDNFEEAWQIRNMFYCEDLESQWYYTDANDANIKFLYLPKATNWWAYKDGIVKHGTIYRPKYPKIIVQIFCSINSARNYVESNFGTFSDYNIEYDYDTRIHTDIV